MVKNNKCIASQPLLMSVSASPPVQPPNSQWHHLATQMLSTDQTVMLSFPHIDQND